MKKFIYPFLSVMLVLLVWQAAAWKANNPGLVPGLPELAGSITGVLTSAGFVQAVTATVARGLAGIFLSLTAATAAALLFARIPWVYELFGPVLAGMRSVPVISFILLALIFMQPESIPLLIAFLTMFPLLAENLTQGIRNLRPELRTLGRTFRIKKTNYYTQLLYPQLKPFLFSGLASATGFGWRAIIMGEVLAQCAAGIGSEMKRAQTFIDIPALLAWTLVAIAIGFLFDRLLARAEQAGFPIVYRQCDLPENNAPRRQQAERASVTSGQPQVTEQATGNPVIRLAGVSKSYGGIRIIDRLTLDFEKGKIYGLSAPSGSGKSTLLNLINGSVLPSAGTVHTDRTLGMGCVFQEAALLPGLSVTANICLPLATWYTRRTAERKAQEWLGLTETEALGQRLPGGLSYGQQQRVALARALACPAPVVLLDEPFKGLDRELTERILVRLKKKLRDSGQTVIFVTHQPDELDRLADVRLNLF
ncbi:MAG: ATP-binding cassette domain-containing protein [Parabacteroides sp.]|nr:ATP-binding cassette domain-containing protein [Parabacteroides sp.]